MLLSVQNKLCWGENKKYQNCAKDFWKYDWQADDDDNDDGDDDDELISLNCHARLIPCKMKDQGAIM